VVSPVGGQLQPQHIKNFPVGNSRNLAKYFLNFSTLMSNLSKMFQGGDFKIWGVVDQGDHGESENELKTGTGSRFRRHFGEKPISGFF